MPKKPKYASKQSKIKKRKSTTRSNADSETNPDPKRVKQVNFVNPDTLLQADETNDENTLEEAIEEVLDIKNEEFTVSQSVILGTTPVLEDTDCVKLGRFNYREWEVEAIKKVDQVAAKTRIDFTLDKTTAIVGAKGVAKDRWLTFNILEAAAWRKVEGIVEKWMRQQKQDIMVKLVSVYERKASGNAIILNDEAGGGSKEGKASKLSLWGFLIFRTVQKTEKNRYGSRL